MSEITRREFVIATTAVACSCLCRSSNLLMAAESKPGPIAVGSLKDFTQDGVVDKWAVSNGFLLIRNEGKLYATSSICTHMGTIYLQNHPEDGQLVCLAHGSRFSLQGAVIQGPAKRPLTHFAIHANADGSVSVDTSKSFEQEKWDDPASFIKVS